MSRVTLQDRLRSYVSYYQPAEAPIDEAAPPLTRFDSQRKMVMPWGLREKVDRIHAQLQKHLVRKNKDTGVNSLVREKFQILEKGLTPITLLGLTQLLKKAEIDSGLMDEDFEALYRYYDIDGKGQMDLTDLLVGLRYAMRCQDTERDNIIRALQLELKRQNIVPTAGYIESALEMNGLPKGSTNVNEREFVRALRGLCGDACTPSELLFLFSTMVDRDRTATVNTHSIAKMLESATGRKVSSAISSDEDDSDEEGEKTPGEIDVYEIVGRVGKNLYVNSDAGVVGTLALRSHLTKFDHDLDGMLDLQQFENAMRDLGLNEEDAMVLFVFSDPENRGKIVIDAVMKNFHIRDYVDVEAAEMQGLVDRLAACLKQRNASLDGAPGSVAIMEKYDSDKSGKIGLAEFTDAIRHLCGKALLNIEIEAVFARFTGDEDKIDFKKFLLATEGEPDLTPKAAPAPAKPKVSATEKSIQKSYRKILMALYSNSRDLETVLVKLRRILARYDKKRQGTMSLEEFHRALHSLPIPTPITSPEASRLFNKFAVNQVINYRDFIEQGFAQSDAVRIWEKAMGAKPRSAPTTPAAASPAGGAGSPQASGSFRRLSVTNYVPSIDRNYQIPFMGLSVSIAHEVVANTVNADGACGVVGLRKALTPADSKAGINKISLKDFKAGLKQAGVTALTAEQIEEVFDSYDHRVEGLMSSDEFIKNVEAKIMQQGTPSKDQMYDILASFHQAVRVSVSRNPVQLRRLFNKHDTRNRQTLDMKEFTRLVREMIGEYTMSVPNIEKLFKFMLRDGVGGLTFKEFEQHTRGLERPSDRSIQELHKVLLDACYGPQQPNVTQGTIALSKAMWRFEQDNSGTLPFPAFQKAVESLGLRFSEPEIKSLFQYHDTERTNAVRIKSFVDSLRHRHTYLITDQILLPLLKLIFDGIVSRGATLQRPDRVERLIAAYDENKNGELDLQQFTKMATTLSLDLLSPYECELIYNYFNRGAGNEGLKIDAFVEALIQGNQYHKLTPEKEPQWRSPAKPPGPTKKQIDDIQRRLVGLLYMPNELNTGSLQVVKLLASFDKDNDGKISKEDFRNALMRYNIKPTESYVSNDELEILFDSYDVHKTGKISIEEFVTQCRVDQETVMAPDGIELLLSLLREQLYANTGILVNSRVRTALKMWDLQSTDRLDLIGFAKTIRRFDNNQMSDIHIELLFNHFCPERLGTISVGELMDRIIPEKEPPPGPPLSAIETERLFERLGTFFYERYSLTQRQTGVRDILRVFQMADTDDDGHIDLAQFSAALRKFGLELQRNEIASLFNSLLISEDLGPLISIADFLRAVRVYQRGAIQSSGDLDSIIQILRVAVADRGRMGAIGCLRVFERYDGNEDGFLDYNEFETAIRELIGNAPKPITQKDVAVLWDAFGGNENGSIDFKHFFESVQYGPLWKVEDPETPSARGEAPTDEAEPSPPWAEDFRSTRGSVRGAGRQRDRQLLVERMAYYQADGRLVAALQTGALVATSRSSYGASPKKEALESPSGSGIKIGAGGSPEVAIITDHAAQAALSFDDAEVTDVKDDDEGSNTSLPGGLADCNSIAEWLALLGLERYVQVFKECDIELDVVGDLTEEDLVELGIALGPRKKILRAAKTMLADQVIREY